MCGIAGYSLSLESRVDRTLAAQALLAGIDAGNRDRESLNEFLSTYSAEGVSKEQGWTEEGEPRSGSVWAYTVRGGEIVALDEIAS